VGEMEAVIKKSEILVMDLIKILKEEAIKKGGLEGEVKRAKMHMIRWSYLKEQSLRWQSCLERSLC
jgi:hypothetical protein